MSAEDEDRFQQSLKCWIYDKLFDVRDDKVRDHLSYNRKIYKGSAHWSLISILNWLKKFL